MNLRKILDNTREQLIKHHQRRNFKHDFSQYREEKRVFSEPAGLKNAAEIMTKEIEGVKLREPAEYVVSNVTGKPTKNFDEIRANLLAQITGQVRWYDSIIAMKNAGVEAFYEVGNGQVLRKMNKAITLQPKCLSI